MTRDNIDAAGACADLISRGASSDVARTLVQQLAGADDFMRVAIAAGILVVLGPCDVDGIRAWLRRYGYLPAPTRCRWCGAELHARSHVAVQVDGIACARCALKRGVS